MSSFKQHLHQAGNKFGNIKNSEHAAQFVGNFNVGGNISVRKYNCCHCELSTGAHF